MPVFVTQSVVSLVRALEELKTPNLTREKSSTGLFLSLSANRPLWGIFHDSPAPYSDRPISKLLLIAVAVDVAAIKLTAVQCLRVHTE